MQYRTRCLICRKDELMFLNRKLNGLTPDLFSAMRFQDEDDAMRLLQNNSHAPTDKENYKCVPVKITIEVIEDVQ